MAAVLRRTLVHSVHFSSILTKLTVRHILFLLILVSTTDVFSQRNIQIKSIDSIVSIVNKNKYHINEDSSIQSSTYTGIFSMRTYRIAHLDDSSLHKYENRVHSYFNQNGTESKRNGFNVFFFHQGKLIKVEELMDEDGKIQKADWYYTDNKLIHHTFKSDKSEERASFLLELSKTIYSQYIK
jgi:hypothetical protein